VDFENDVNATKGGKKEGSSLRVRAGEKEGPTLRNRNQLRWLPVRMGHRTPRKKLATLAYLPEHNVRVLHVDDATLAANHARVGDNIKDEAGN
jgi:hypothetical protein